MILDAHQRRREARNLEFFGNDQRDRLPAEANLVVIERTKRGAGRRDVVVVGFVRCGELGPVRMREDGNHAVDRHRVLEIDACDPPPGNCG